MEGRQYSERELIELMTYREKQVIKTYASTANYWETFISINNSKP